MASTPDSFFQKTGININNLAEISEEDKKSGIYLILNVRNERFYIGSSVNLYKRKIRHLWELKINKHHNIFLQRDYNQNGLPEKDFKFIVLKSLATSKLLLEEQVYLDMYSGIRDFYNINKQTIGGALGRKVTDETKQLISQKNKGQKRSEKTKKQMSKYQKIRYESGTHNLIGYKHSEDTKKQISESNKGDKNHFFGKTHTDETKNKIRNKLIGKYYGPTVKIMAINLTTKEELIFDSISKAAKSLNLQASHISSVANGKLKQHKGWYFCKVMEDLNGN